MRDAEAADGLRMAFAAEEAMDRAAKVESPPITHHNAVKVREVIFSGPAPRMVLEKYGLDWKTGKWIRVQEGEAYPECCYADVIKPCCERWRGKMVAVAAYENENRAHPEWLVAGRPAACFFCPECGGKL